MKKILILGAGIYQLPLIKKAKALNYFVNVASIPGKYPGFQHADCVSYINTTDYKAILSEAKDSNIDAILTTGTDVAIKSIGYVNSQLHKTGIQYECACFCVNKAKMKEQFIFHGVSCASFKKCYNIDDCIQAFHLFNHQAILKVVDKSGSRGISKLENENSIPEIFNTAIQVTDLDYVIVEEYIYGIEIGIDGMIQNGEFIHIEIHDKINAVSNHRTIPLGHIFPHTHQKYQDNIINECKKAILSLGINNCPFNIDAFICENGKVYIIEVGARCGATGIPELMSIYLDQDYYKDMIDCSLGIPIKSSNHSNPCASILIHSDQSGKLLNYCIPDCLSIDEIVYDHSIGEKIESFTDGTKRLGHIILKNENIAQLKADIHTLTNMSLVEVEPYE